MIASGCIIVIVMKAKFLALTCFGLSLAAVLPAAELKDVKSVYLYPMVGGLDQHLANVLTKEHLFRVVSDPKLADALFTDQLGQQFEYRVAHMKRDPAVPHVPAPATSTPTATQPATGTVAASETEPHESSFSRGKGTIFLVDAKSRQVVWSDYHRPKNTSSHELEKTAKKLALNLTQTITPPVAK